VKSIDDMNEKYFIVDIGSSTVVGEEIGCEDPVTKRKWTEYRFRTFTEFKSKLVKDLVLVPKGESGNTLKALADLWLKDAEGRQYDRLVYAPPGSNRPIKSDDLNGWKGFTVAPSPGSWKLTKDFIFRVACQKDLQLFNWLLDWMAALYQKPGQHAETALICVGPQGVGKNVFADLILGWTFDGRHYRCTTHTRQVLGDFNAILSGLCLLVLDEVGLKTISEANATKGLITGHTIDINRKGLDIEWENSMLHLVFLSNNTKEPIKVDPDDRRYAFLDFSDDNKNDAAFFARISEELVEGGRSAMLSELLARDINWMNQRIAPDSATKQRIKRHSMGDAQSFLMQYWRDLGEKRWNNHKNEHVVAKDQLIRLFMQWRKDTNSDAKIRDPKEELRIMIKSTVPKDYANDERFCRSRRPPEGGPMSRGFWSFPSWAEYSESFTARTGISLKGMNKETEVDTQMDLP